MPFDHQSLATAVLTDVPVRYAESDVMLYALGVGLGSNPLDADELAYVTEHQGLRTLPTFASMIIPETLIAESGCDLQQILHRAQSLKLFRPMPSKADMLVNQRVASVADLGRELGAEIVLETELRLAGDESAP